MDHIIKSIVIIKDFQKSKGKYYFFLDSDDFYKK